MDFNNYEGVFVIKRKYPIIDVARTGQNIKHIMQARGFNVKNIQDFFRFSTPQSIYHWFDGRNMPTVNNLCALSGLFRLLVDTLLKGNRNYEYRPAENAMYQRITIYYEKFLRPVSVMDN